MQEVIAPFQIQCYHVWPTHHPSSWKAQLRRAFGVCLREKLWSLRYMMCKWCAICTACKQSTPLHQVTKAPQMLVAKCNYHTIFPTGRGVRILCSGSPSQWHIWENCELRLAHAAPPRQEQKCPQQILLVAQVDPLLEHKDWKKEAIIVLMFSQHGG